MKVIIISSIFRMLKSKKQFEICVCIDFLGKLRNCASYLAVTNCILSFMSLQFRGHFGKLKLASNNVRSSIHNIQERL